MDKHTDPSTPTSLPSFLLEDLIQEQQKELRADAALEASGLDLSTLELEGLAEERSRIPLIALSAILFLAGLLGAALILVPGFGNQTGVIGLTLTTVGLGYVVLAGLVRYGQFLRSR